jgi:uncharacterized protein YkwD
MWRIILPLCLLTTVLTNLVQAEPNREVVALTNSYRAQYGMPPLRVSYLLEGVAAVQAMDMRRNRFFSHYGSDGSDIGDRALQQGYRYCVIAENIAQGHRSPRGVTRGWIQSPGHRENLLDPDVTEIGVDRQRGNLWVMVLGRRC